jgi:uracil-DNA glycosylase family 4
VGEELLQARWIAWLKRIGRDKATSLLALTQTLDAALIQRHESSWDWELLSANAALPWSCELIDRYEDRWNWTALTFSQALPWSVELIERYKDRWWWWGERPGGGFAPRGLIKNEALPWSLELIEYFIGCYANRSPWFHLSESEALPWSLELIERYKDRWEWGKGVFEGLSKNKALPWSLELIERYRNRWGWERLSTNEGLPWSPELLERFKDQWHWGGPPWGEGLRAYADGLSGNEALPWSLELIKRYEDRWHWGGGPYHRDRDAGGKGDGLSGNKALPWSLELIERYKHRWEWRNSDRRFMYRESLSSNEALPWSLELIERYKDRWGWGWDGLSSNAALPWSLELIERYKDRWEWGWKGLSSNAALPWSLELIERYKDRWEWGKCVFGGLSKNKALPWSLELIERYEDRWDWAHLSCNKGLPWSPELVEQYKGRWDWEKLSHNKGLPWSLELIERFEDRLDWDSVTPGLQRTKVLVLSSSAIDELMTHYAASDRDAYAANLQMAEALAPAAGLDWEPLRAAVAACTRCALHATRTQTVFGVGNRNARCMLIGDAPGALDERQGEPFVGRAGELLNSMIHALGLQRADVFIANILKCRPPGNRDPTPEEVLQCRGYLDRQIELVSPTLIVAVGRIAAQNLLSTDTALARLRGKVHAFGSRSRPLVVTYHPAYLLRSPSEKRKAWQDLLLARQILARVEHEGGVAP